MADLRILFEKYMDDTISDDEYHQLLSLIDDPGFRDEFTSLIQESYLSYRKTDDDPVPIKQTDDILQAIFEKAAQNEEHGYSNTGHHWRKLLFRRSVAAILVVMLGVGAILHWREKRQVKPFVAVIDSVKTVPNAAIAPATNAAVLTLSNGKQILLDSSKNGLIAQQGTAKIVNTAGQLNLMNNGQGSPAIVYNNTLSTNRANIYHITLSDGTKVWLNAASSITFPNVFAQNERRISITGEAYFEVAKDPLKPFVVDINGISVKVLGTHFNVNAYNLAKVSTTLLQGSVQITDGLHNTLIKPGEAAEVTKADISVRKVNLDKAIAWKNHEFYFEKDPLTAIMEQLGRWYGVDIQYDGKLPDQNVFYSGNISRNAKLSDVLLMLHKISNADFDVHDKRIKVEF